MVLFLFLAIAARLGGEFGEESVACETGDLREVEWERSIGLGKVTDTREKCARESVDQGKMHLILLLMV